MTIAIALPGSTVFNQPVAQQANLVHETVFDNLVPFSWLIQAKTTIENGSCIDRFLAPDLRQVQSLPEPVRAEIQAILGDDQSAWLYEIRTTTGEDWRPEITVHGFFLTDFRHSMVLKAWVTGTEPESGTILRKACAEIIPDQVEIPVHPFGKVRREGVSRVITFKATPAQFTACSHYRLLGDEVRQLLDVHETLASIRRIQGRLTRAEEMVDGLCREAECSGAVLVIVDREEAWG